MTTRGTIKADAPGSVNVAPRGPVLRETDVEFEVDGRDVYVRCGATGVTGHVQRVHSETPAQAARRASRVLRDRAARQACELLSESMAFEALAVELEARARRLSAAAAANYQQTVAGILAAPELPTAVGVNADGFVLAPPTDLEHGYIGAAGLADRAYADASDRKPNDVRSSIPDDEVELEAYVLAIIDAFNPPDDDVAQVSILLDAIETAALFIESQPCTCDAPDGDPCDRCVALGRFADVRIAR